MRLTSTWSLSKEDIEEIDHDDVIPLVGTYGDFIEYYRQEIDKMALEEIMGQ